jgi:hypothetical protein
VRRASIAAFVVGFTLILIGSVSGTTPVTIIGALVTAATVATFGVSASRRVADPPPVTKKADDEVGPEKHLEGMNFRLTDSWDIWEH